jgi:hypothetical protein
MTENNLAPPPELVEQWEADWHCSSNTNGNGFTYFVATRAAQWGADMELEACCELMDRDFMAGPSDLRAARRPKPPSLKEQAYAALDAYIYGNPDHSDKQNTYNIIRRALEQLDD